MKKLFVISLLIFNCLSTFSQSNDENLIATKYNVLPVPNIFNSYISDTIYKKINDRRIKLSDYLQSSSDFAWTVYSDRKNNLTYRDSRKREDEEWKKLDFMEAFRVKAVKGNMVHIIRPTSRKNYEDFGWIDANRLILGKFCSLSKKGAAEKRMILTSASDLDINDDKAVLKGLKDKNYFFSPTLEDRFKSTKLASKFEILFVIKQTNKAVFLSKTDRIRSKSDVYGWISKVKTTHWNHRVCLEPVSGRRVKDRFCEEENSEGKCIKFKQAYVFLEPYQLDRYFENAEQVKRSWVLHSIPLSPKRMTAQRMRYPIMEWNDKGYNKQKIAVIAEFGDDISNSSYDTDDKLGQESLLQRRLDSIMQLQENVNVLVVLDGTASMEKYGPAVASSINKIIEDRTLDLEKSNKKIEWGLAIYRDYLDKKDDKLFELIPISSSYQRVIKKLKNGISYKSNNKKFHAEAHYYGMTEALKNGGFKKGQSNILLLVGDAGNHQVDEMNLNKEDVIDLIVQKDVNVISFQVNYLTSSKEAKKTYQKFNKDSRNYIIESGKRQLSKQKGTRSQYFVGLNPEKQNSYSVAYDGYGFNENWPTFGVFNHAMPGEAMNVGVFSNNLTKSFKEYMNRLDKWTDNINSLVSSSGQVYELMDEQEKINFDLKLRDICDRLQLTEDQCDMLKNEGQISISGFVHTTINDQKVLTEVAYMSKTMKRNIDERLNALTAIRSSNITKVRENFYKTIVMIVQGLVGENTGEEIIGNYTFDQIWDIILGVPFSSSSPLKDKKINSLLGTEITADEIQEFLAVFINEVDRFIDFPKQKDMFSSVFRKNGQEFYWIPLQKIPRGGE